MDVQRAQRDAATWLRRACPDVRDCGCYILSPTDVPDLASGFVCGLACTQVRLDELLRPALERRGEWVGRGFCTLIDGKQIDTFSRFVCVVAHELAHWLEFSEAQTSTPSIESMSPEQLAKQFASTAVALRTESSVHVAADERPWSTHGLRFTRACVHLRYRLWAAEFPFRGEDLPFAGRQYGLSGPEWYHAVLRDETRALADLPVREILQRGVPTELSRLWFDDTGEDVL